MAGRKLTKAELKTIHEAVAHFGEHRLLFKGFAEAAMEALRTDPELAKYIHFIKYRLKSPDRLEAKLLSKAAKSKPGKFAIKSANLFQTINDLAGIRILHLHTKQIDAINKHIKRVLTKQKIQIIEGPTVHCWDRDYENLFAGFGIPAKKVDEDKPGSQKSMYTSVHYVLEANEKTKITFELQVRTLADELWGEVSHKVEYEEAQPDEHIHDQLAVLARMTSAATRQVDCIFDTFTAKQNLAPTKRKRAKDRRKNRGSK